MRERERERKRKRERRRERKREKKREREKERQDEIDQEERVELGKIVEECATSQSCSQISEGRSIVVWTGQLSRWLVQSGAD